ncbi:hypothetical protein [Helicobacter macacae]|uniref:Uncharacterized protein n=1 Tax=Helicobacter macacae MIT 99-5501 TaxID=1357400 RepID=V8C4C6_9HELI|nr:hypothetical protein [Helicobacter macacae]ETD22224.1 hypothetical protein HMPREF2086_01955 [Helicobacter macacae MIT 99-5501]
MRFVGRFWLCKLCKLCKSCKLYKICLGLAVVGMIGCATKSPNTNKNIENSSVQGIGQNITKVTINISSQIDGLNKSVLTHWCKVDDESAEDKNDKQDKDNKDDKTDTLKQDFTPQSTHSKDFSSQDSKNHKSHSELDLQAKPTHTTQNPIKLDTTKPPKCKAIGGANAFFRALKTSRFRAPRDEVVELEAGVYYLAAFEIEAKRHILRSCDEEASKCGGYEGGKPRFLAFRVDSGENLILPKVIILPKVEAKEANLASDFDSKTNDKKSDKKSKEGKRAKKDKNDEPKELIFVILEDFDKQGSENLPHKAESKRGNAIFSLGSSVSFEFDSTQNNKNEATPKSSNQKSNDTDSAKDEETQSGSRSNEISHTHTQSTKSMD